MHKGFYAIDTVDVDRMVVCSYHFPNNLFDGLDCRKYPVLRPTAFQHVCDDCWVDSVA